MDFEECTINFRHIKCVLNTLQDIQQKALELEESQNKHNLILDKKFFQKAWNLQFKNAKSFIILEQVLNPKYYLQKISNLFKKKEDRKLSKLQKLEDFYHSLNSEDMVFKIDSEIKFQNIEFVTPCSIYLNFTQKIESVIKYLSVFDYFHYFISKKSIPILENLVLEYQDEMKSFIIKNQEEQFQEYVKEKTKEFTKKTESDREKTIFSSYSYDGDFLFGYFSLTYTDSIKIEIDKYKIIYQLLLDNYRNSFNHNNRLTYYNLVDLNNKKDDPFIILDNIENFFIFEECNILTELNYDYNFSIYTEVHETLLNLILEMKKRNTIPEYLEKRFLEQIENSENRNRDFEFANFYKKIVEKYTLKGELDKKLSQKKNPIKRRINKI